MRSHPAVFNTDGVNRRNEYLPLSALTESVERQAERCVTTGLPIGLPLNVSHDLCRPAGWAQGDAILIAADCGRYIGEIFEPETDAERQQVGGLIQRFRTDYDNDAIAPHIPSLATRLEDLARDDVTFLRLEAAAALALGLAAQAYPEFFRPGAGFVDKDGLVDYARLLERTTQVQPGVFHEPVRDVLLFAHPYFRRSLSHRNTLNGYVLGSFEGAAKSSPDLTARLRLDPDVLGHPESATWHVELEYWHGPKFQDDLAQIPAGVAEHKSSASERHFSGVDRTQIWWKTVEDRPDPAGLRRIRTFEVEELVEDTTFGLNGDRYGCRYAHAEFDVDQGVISHFDGAIRAYEAEAYFARIERQIDRAGKHADYTKLFRLDGPLPLQAWKRLLMDAFRGNHLIPEYLGADADSPTETQDVPEATDAPETPPLMVQISFAALPEPSPLDGVRLAAEQAQRVGQFALPVAEVGRGALAALLRGWSDTGSDGMVECDGEIANLGVVELGGADVREHWREAAGRLADAIDHEVAANALSHLSVAFRWALGQVATTLSASGEAARVAALLRAAQEIVDPTTSSAGWVEPLRDALVSHTPPVTAPLDWPISALRLGRLIVPRSGRFTGQLVVPQSLWTALEAANASVDETDVTAPRLGPAALEEEGAVPLSFGGSVG